MSSGQTPGGPGWQWPDDGSGGQGYGGQGPDPYGSTQPPPPPGQYDPYAQPYGQPYGQYDPYGQYGYQPYGYAYGYPAPRRNDSVHTQAIVSLIINLIAAVSCCNIGGIVGAILAGVGMSRTDSDPESAKKMVIGSWIALGVGFALTIGFFVFLGVIGAFDDSSS